MNRQSSFAFVDLREITFGVVVVVVVVVVFVVVVASVIDIIIVGSSRPDEVAIFVPDRENKHRIQDLSRSLYRYRSPFQMRLRYSISTRG